MLAESEQRSAWPAGRLGPNPADGFAVGAPTLRYNDAGKAAVGRVRDATGRVVLAIALTRIGADVAAPIARITPP